MAAPPNSQQERTGESALQTASETRVSRIHQHTMHSTNDYVKAFIKEILGLWAERGKALKRNHRITGTFLWPIPRHSRTPAPIAFIWTSPSLYRRPQTRIDSFDFDVDLRHVGRGIIAGGRGRAREKVAAELRDTALKRRSVHSAWFPCTCASTSTLLHPARGTGTWRGGFGWGCCTGCCGWC
jgi:hypothetical protein